MRPVTVSQINTYIKRTLAADPILANVTVKGEISRITWHSSGHLYFTLKDEASSISCFLPADRVQLLRFEPAEGMEVLATGSISVFEKRGSYSLNLRLMEPEGEGALAIAFEKLRVKLEEEGLFDASHKRPIPAFPRLIGVVTSPTGAAIHDIITTVKRRDPLADIVLYPCLVQGDGAAATICEGIRVLNEKFPQADVLIVGRGGGSKEDLWCFNEESVARAVYRSRIPVISAVGHEVDICICDWAADLRAATPTAAAEAATPDIRSYTDAIEMASPSRLGRVLQAKVQAMEDHCRFLAQGLRQYTESRLEDSSYQLQRLKETCCTAASQLLADKSYALDVLKSRIDGADPHSILDKGYAAARTADGRWITDADQLQKGDRFELIFANGTVNCLAEGRKNG
ncbi:MAG: exodeoxyribonuclease VII large subunit [Firmicutes bacterium]|nr:exodeoxyribonuclease VII large subunit [Bacillota bacterium]